MELFDQEQADRRSQVDVPGAEVQGKLEEHQVLGATMNDQHESDRIEEEIEERNRAYRDMKKTVHTSMPDLPEEERESTKQKEILYSVPVEQLNMQVMNPQQADYCVDIIAVHGLGAIPNITWTEKSSGINWLSSESMLPSTALRARILRFGYDSLWMGKTPIRTSLSTIAYKLLLGLSMIRMEDLQRPLIFVGHCFGGLVVQRALNLAKMQQDAYPGVFDSTVGIVFLGTPHRGTQSFTQDSALFAAIAASSDLSRKLETGVLESIASDNGALLDVTDDFVRLCIGGGPLITCFFEQRPSKLGKIVGKDDIDEFIVDQKSATLDGRRKYGLELDHFSLNKFDGPTNPNYVQVRGEILRFYHEAMQRVDTSSWPGPNRAAGPRLTVSKEGLSNDCLASGPSSRTLSRRQSSFDLRNPTPRLRRHGTSRGNLDANVEVQPEPFRTEHAIRREAMDELRKEEEYKQRRLYEEEARKQQRQEKQAMEQEYIARLKRNMAKHGVKNSDEILATRRMPDDEDLTQQEITEKEGWYKNLMKGELLAVGLNGGQIDEILHNTDESMIIDGMEMIVTRMARKWISTRTLDKYEIPWQDDETDPSTIIIKRWVPDYEREFLWDHSRAVRSQRDYRSHRERHRPIKSDRHRRRGSEPSNAQDNDWVVRMMDNFTEKRNKYDRTTTLGPRTPVSNRDTSYTRNTKRHSTEGPGSEEARPKEIRKKSSRASFQSADLSKSRSNPRSSPRPTSSTEPKSLRRIRSTLSFDSIRPAPDVQEVNRRRRSSQALSQSFTRVHDRSQEN
ncbi:hypothetical protein HBH64_072750 [Parastagonospora nodorum]|nr:hypothetical protein HBI10_107520 [Parastagonospora nodorum]KAH4022365.1 hypothetical protein HBI13_101680 [Parastagonospora nodorum]KAH4121293.1 hypothetical protein HBH47_102110 [Parastagonospora nodorum]KAH4256146.1 hypothetical protein HBI03_168550 [Parastagonospora nodorum]KAH4268708.1 hypothetical protein HBI04_161560 [Parastagonospora nodorum]